MLESILLGLMGLHRAATNTKEEGSPFDMHFAPNRRYLSDLTIIYIYILQCNVEVATARMEESADPQSEAATIPLHQNE
jgi:hypothetical protein